MSILFLIALTLALDTLGFKHSFTSPNKRKYPTAVHDGSISVLEESAPAKLDSVLSIFKTAAGKPVDLPTESEFVPPSTKAWMTTLSLDTATPSAPPVIVAPPSPQPPDVLKFFQTGSLDAYHEGKVMELIEKTTSLTYFTAEDTAMVLQAMRLAYCAFYGKRTQRSLEALINRARGTAAVLGELKADLPVVLAGILHDVLAELPMGEFPFEMRSNLVRMFGFDAITLAEDYSRLPKYQARTAEYSPMASENRVQMLVALSEDYRSLYIRLADRLHVMRVLRSLPLEEDERRKIALEALHVYAPLAHKMGVMTVKGELEDLAFRVINPELFLETKRTQWLAHKALHEGYSQIQELLANDEKLRASGASFRLPFRVKDKYQLALKMARKGLKSVTDVRDAVGMRVIFDLPRLAGESDDAFGRRQEEMCYHIVKRIQGMSGWEPSEDGFKDYLKAKKANGYASLHQYMRHQALDTHLEVQVRSLQMHRNAELGEAAHWSYKDQLYRSDIANSKLYKIAWRSPAQAEAKSAAELIGLAKRQLNAARVFVLLEDKSTVLNLRKGATALDGAFAVHTDVGLSTQSISVRGVPVGFKQVLRNGDIISVSTSRGAITAQPSWLSIARLSYSQAVIRKHLRRKHESTLLAYTSRLCAAADEEEELVVASSRGASTPPVLSWLASSLFPAKKANMKSNVAKMQKPYSLDAASLSSPLLRLAREGVAISLQHASAPA